MKPTKRKQFKFYRSYFDVYNELSNKDKIIFIDSLLDKQFLNKDPENLTGIIKIVWTSLYHSIDTQVKGYESKTGNILNSNNQDINNPMQGGIKGGIIGPKVEEEEKEEVKEKYRIPTYQEFKTHALEKCKKNNLKFLESDLRLKYDAWIENGWKTGNDKKIKNWKSTLTNTIPHMFKSSQEQKPYFK